MQVQVAYTTYQVVQKMFDALKCHNEVGLGGPYYLAGGTKLSTCWKQSFAGGIEYLQVVLTTLREE